MVVWLGQAVSKNTAASNTAAGAIFFKICISVSFFLVSVLFEGERRNAACSLPKHLRQSKDAVRVESVFLKARIGFDYLPNQPIGLPDRSTQTLLTLVYISSACLPISRP